MAKYLANFQGEVSQREIEALAKIPGAKMILITGASGFIGKHLLLAAQKQKFLCCALSRTGEPLAGAEKSFCWNLGDEIPNEILRDLKFAVHLAHDFSGETGAAVTHSGTVALIKELYKRGVEAQVFVSSLSAGKHAISRYGRVKSAIETEIKDLPNAIIVRPGLVVGNGGIFRNLSFWSTRLPIIPLPGGGQQQVQVISLDRLCNEILNILSQQIRPSEANIFLQESITLRELVTREARLAGKRPPLIVNMPTNVMLACLRAAELVGVDLKITTDNLLGLIQNQSSPYRSTLSD